MIRRIVQFICGMKDMPYKATEIAWKILKEAKKKGISLTNLQLQKLIYIAHGYFIALYNKPLSEDRIDAWTYGPVVYNAYQEFKNYKNKTIHVDEDIKTDLDEKEKEEFVINGVLKLYGNMTAPQLVSLTHQKGTPWRETWDNEAEQKYLTPIDNGKIKNHFRKAISDPKSTVGL